MTDRINALVVVLEADYRDDDIQGLADAIKRFRFVRDVKLNVADLDSTIAEARVKGEMREQLYAVLRP